MVIRFFLWQRWVLRVELALQGKYDESGVDARLAVDSLFFVQFVILRWKCLYSKFYVDASTLLFPTIPVLG